MPLEGVSEGVCDARKISPNCASPCFMERRQCRSAVRSGQKGPAERHAGQLRRLFSDQKVGGDTSLVSAKSPASSLA